MHTSPLLDLRSASLVPTANDIQAWASGRRVFVSSLITDLRAERAAVRRAIESVGARPVMFEIDLGGQDISAGQVYLAGVRSSDIYVGLFGPRYGVRMPDGYSATQAEFLEAERNGLRLCLYVHGETSSDMDGAQRDLIQGVRNLYTTSSWADPSDLQDGVARRLADLAAEELAPWIRIGRAFIRAREIQSDGRTITVAAEVRSNAVHAELVRLRDNHTGDLPFASPSEARDVQVASLSTITRSVETYDVRLVLNGRDISSTGIRMATGTLGPDELAKRALQDSLFSTSSLGASTLGIASPTDPLAPIRGMSLDDAVLRPVARLLITEHLLRSGSANTVDSFALGPSHSGSRRLQLAWTPQSRYINMPDPEPMSLDGEIRDI